VVVGMVAICPVPYYSSLIKGRSGAQWPIEEGHRSWARSNEYNMILLMALVEY
jgi:hypothetical protein